MGDSGEEDGAAALFDWNHDLPEVPETGDPTSAQPMSLVKWKWKGAGRKQLLDTYGRSMETSQDDGASPEADAADNDPDGSVDAADNDPDGSADDKHYFHGLTGEGQLVAILDTGIYKEHPAFSADHDIIHAASKNFTEKGEEDDITDEDGHGTLCAGLIIAQECAEYAGKPTGVAQQAQLLVLKVFGDGNCSYERVAEAIDYAVNSEATVISMSLGFQDRGRGSSGLRRLHSVVHAALAKGVVIVVAAGNLQLKGHYYGWINGTSAATPLVAGLAALIKQAGNLSDRSGLSDALQAKLGESGLTGANTGEVYEILRGRSESPDHHTQERGYGKLNGVFERVVEEADDDEVEEKDPVSE
ncbi:hypothetical protein I4F81_005145 [Pyropia yezoensis]|uniref:Uncharacterized protein n=1 Tax=Pyropia yezoensis TaxID=2788 RepID=A0ACC3BXF5_PYRYE|nr:hypothetical protein I4F81_005145 [Neopyropia yezoensis]